MKKKNLTKRAAKFLVELALDADVYGSTISTGEFLRGFIKTWPEQSEIFQKALEEYENE
jgi:predicted nucleic acid-binding protein